MTSEDMDRLERKLDDVLVLLQRIDRRQKRHGTKLNTNQILPPGLTNGDEHDEDLD